MEYINKPDELQHAVKQLSAIAHAGRLVLLRLLIKAGPDGMPATTLANLAKTKLPTASAQLLILSNAGLTTSKRVGRQIIYRADYESMTGLLKYLMLDCCSASHDICMPLVPELQSAIESCCTPNQPSD